MALKVKAVERLLKFNKNENDPFRRRAVYSSESTELMSSRSVIAFVLLIR